MSKNPACTGQAVAAGITRLKLHGFLPSSCCLLHSRAVSGPDIPPGGKSAFLSTQLPAPQRNFLQKKSGVWWISAGQLMELLSGLALGAGNLNDHACLQAKKGCVFVHRHVARLPAARHADIRFTTRL